MRTILLLALLLTSPLSWGGMVEPRSFETAEEEIRFKRLIAELRCLVCQNQNLADSDADLAKDLRRETYTMIKAGQTDKEIIEFMVNRYGDFVLYRPPVKSSTYLLWFGPFLLLSVGLGIVIWQVRRRTAAPPPPALSDTEKARLETLLRERGGP